MGRPAHLPEPSQRRQVAGSRSALAAAKWGVVGLTVLLFLLWVGRAGECARRMA